ncbi:c-type cytochrome [Flavobacterium sp. UBA6135]|uniref:c-type cytochrome n=1 Tax=Flavobacterium sp. UBA6135 TaxID=1946553 RepID=UPI0025BF22AF|nr:c-type cytochrome [Flavobacterium sp. UBA6135]
MRNLFFLLFVVVFISCGDKKPEPFGKASDEVLKEATPIVVDEKLKLGEELFNGVGMCKSCHLPDKKVIGPSIVEIARIYKDKEASMVEFLKENAEPIVDPSQYEVMKTNFAITKTMTDEELKALEAYMYSFLK